MEVILREKEADDWIYRGEGAANLVLAYNGSSSSFASSSFSSSVISFSLINRIVFEAEECVFLCRLGK